VRRCARTPFIILLKAAVQAPDKEWPPFGGCSQMVAWAMRAWRIACAAVCWTTVRGRACREEQLFSWRSAGCLQLL